MTIVVNRADQLRLAGKARTGHAREYYVLNDGEGPRIFDVNGLNRDLSIEILRDQGISLFEFQWMFGEHAVKTATAINDLAVAMTQRPDGTAWPDDDDPGGVDAGYTYLGQFIAHEMTHLALDAEGDPSNLSDPQINLGSVFDPPAPTNPCNPNDAMATGCTQAIGQIASFPHDLPRDNAGKAEIADERNDDVLPLAQMHQLMIRFYNRIVAHLPQRSEADHRKIAIQHFQSVVLHDFLKTISDNDVYSDVVENGNRRRFLKNGLVKGQALRLPIEFAAAAFRFGHSMVRDGYRWNRRQSVATPADFWHFTHSSRNSNLAAGPMLALPSDWIINWKQFFTLPPAGRAPEMCAVVKANKIDTQITQLLAEIPLEALENAVAPVNLAQRTLSRSYALNIADAQTAICILNDDLPPGLQITPLSEAEIIGGEPINIQAALTANNCELAHATPIWFYILKEAKRAGGNRLGSFGSRIVVETIHGVLSYSDHSIIADLQWERALGNVNGDKFKMSDLLAFTGELNPVTGCTPVL